MRSLTLRTGSVRNPEGLTAHRFVRGMAQASLTVMEWVVFILNPNNRRAAAAPSRVPTAEAHVCGPGHFRSRLMMTLDHPGDSRIGPVFVRLSARRASRSIVVMAMEQM